VTALAAAPTPTLPRDPTIEVQPVGVEAFDEVLPLVQQFPTKGMRPEDWRYTLFTYPWSNETPRGYALRADGAMVGFMGTVRSERTLRGRKEKLVNPSSWFVLPEFRSVAMRLPLRVLAERDRTIVNLTPSPSSYAIFGELGMKVLEEEQIVLPPSPHPVQLERAVRGSVTLSPDALAEELSGEHGRIHHDLRSSRVAKQVLLRRDGRECFVVATRGRKRHLPFAEIQYISDRAFFWEHRLLVQAGLSAAMGIAGLAMVVDRRFLVGRMPTLAFLWPVRRQYRPSSPDITPDMIDGLYSEMMGLVY
jgi:hypothetical protein